VDFKREQEPVTPRPVAMQPQPVSAQEPTQRVSSRNNSRRLIGGGIVLLLVALIILAFSWMLLSKDSASVVNSNINKDKYQAVFLSNGQVYFGKLQNTAGDSLVLKDIYYLQVDSKIQPSSGDNADVSTKENSDNSDVQLIKLGNELHGPEDQMQITKDQVLFWENLKADGKVSKAIDSYVKE
jgi:hypothetical protein